jgi:hypothetical protein
MGFTIYPAIEAALRWMSQNPIVPTETQMLNMRQETGDDSMTHDYNERAVFLATEWQRRMFLAPEPEVPSEVGDLLWDNDHIPNEKINADIIEAFNRGKKAAIR